MKIKLSLEMKVAVLAVVASAAASSLHAQLVVPYADGSDGALVISNGTVIDLSQAVTGNWTNTSGSPGKGVYDPTQWAVVFKYSSVEIAAGATVNFANHPTHAPVVWLVSGDVTINGNVGLNGQGADQESNRLPEPGPGGYRGGGGPTWGTGSGFGPGGGVGNGAYGSYTGSYGNPQIIPLIGGSGGSGFGGWSVNGGAGGGAILIAATGTITVNGHCEAVGGGNGSGGAIRLVANQITGTGYLIASASGRIRLEANSPSGALYLVPATQMVTPSNPATIFPDANTPTVTVLNIAGLPAPADPKSSMSVGTGTADLTVASTAEVTIQLQTRNFPTTGTVTVYIKPRNRDQTTLTATYVSGDSSAALWQVNTTLVYPMFTVIQARATN